MFDMITARFAEVRMHFKVWHPATLAQGSASEAHMNMDVNLRRLPGLFSYRSKFLVPLADIIQHPYSADRAVILSKQWKDSL